jgi:hypothetical protein
MRAVCEVHLMAVIRFSKENMISEYFDLSSPSKELELVSGGTNIVSVFCLNPNHTVLRTDPFQRRKLTTTNKTSTNNFSPPTKQTHSNQDRYALAKDIDTKADTENASILLANATKRLSFIPLALSYRWALPFSKICV